MSVRKPLPRYDAPADVMEVAGAWLARRDRGLGESERAEFEAWLRADPQHRAAMAQLERAFDTFDGLRELAPPANGEPDPDIFSPGRGERRHGRAGSRARRRFLPFAIAVGLAAAAVLTFVLRPISTPVPPTTWQYTTAAGGYERAVLIDGSTVDLNGATAIAVAYTSSERRVELLRGEAHFQVAKNAERPFVVSAGSVAVRAVGTAFKVRLEPTAVEVLVTEGKVCVAPVPSSLAVATTTAPVEHPLLSAGYKIVVPTAARDAAPAIAIVTSAEIERALAWQPRVTQFTRTPLIEVIAEFNRQSAMRQRPRLVIDDPALETLRIGGSFRADKPEAFVRLLEASFGVSAERSGDTITLRKAR